MDNPDKIASGNRRNRQKYSDIEYGARNKMKHTRLIKTVALMLLFCSFKVIEGFAPAVDNPTSVEVGVKVAGESIGKQSLAVKLVRKWEIYILHHSHVDIGYTHVQTEVVRMHWKYFKQVIELGIIN